MPSKPRFAIQHFGERSGLGAVTVISLAQDTQGFLWIGTQTGLYRYDGAGIQRFGTDEGLPSDSVDLLVVAPDGAIWAGTSKGIARFDGTKFVSVSLPPEAGGVRDCPQPFAVDSGGSVYVSTENGLLVLQAGGAPRLYSQADGLASEQIDAIVRGPDDTIWLAAGQKLYRLPHPTRKPEVFVSLLSADPVRTLLTDSRLTLWIRTDERIGFVGTRRAGAQPRWLEGAVPPANMFGSPSLDQQGNLMLPTPQGLYRYVGGKWQVIDHSNGLTSSAVFAALEDREGDIWVGLAGAGLDHWPNSHQWSGWTDAEGLPDALVLGIVRDQRSRLWVGTNTALAVWDPRTDAWQTWKAPGMDRVGVRQLLLTRDGAVWALFPGKGVFRFETTSARLQAVQVPGSKDWPSRRLTLAPDDSVWAGGDGLLRVIRYQRGRFVVE
ncbi:MAG TPA: two-component regulator propeller domain-containing protein, partial [Terriglobales bacterium]